MKSNRKFSQDHASLTSTSSCLTSLTLQSNPKLNLKMITLNKIFFYGFRLRVRQSTFLSNDGLDLFSPLHIKI